MKTTTYAIAMTVFAIGSLTIAANTFYSDYAAERKCSFERNVNACHKEFKPNRDPRVVEVSVEKIVQLQPAMLQPPREL